MADEKPATPETPATDDAGFTPAERAYMRQEEGATPPPEPPPETPSETPAEPPAEVAQPSETPAAPKEPPKEKAQPQTVPYGALAEERQRRKEAEERVRQQELLNARMEERFRAFSEGRPQQPQQPAAPAAPPSPDKDIFGAVDYTMKKLDATTAEIEAYKRQIAQNEQVARLNKWAAGCVEEYKKTQPDYLDAYRFLRESRAHELRSTWNMGDQAIADQLASEELQLITQAARQRRNAAEIAYSNARARGYKSGAAVPAAKPAEDAPAPDATRQMEIVQHGQQANKSLSGMGGRAGGGVEVAGENILKMSDKEFEAWTTKNPAKWRRLKGAER
jgi:hypothetical protein